jgi:hypothetical protein
VVVRQTTSPGVVVVVVDDDFALDLQIRHAVATLPATLT